jgi:hypothetical protein
LCAAYCQPLLGGFELYKDHDHLSERGSVIVAESIIHSLLSDGWFTPIHRRGARREPGSCGPSVGSNCWAPS